MTERRVHRLTQDGLTRLEQELELLRTVKRQEVAERLRSALADGQDDDFVDNAELESARNDQSFMEGRILELKEILRNYKLIEEGVGPQDRIRLGVHFRVSEEGIDDEEEYMLVGAAEANPSEGRISDESPLGKALLDAKLGDIVTVEAPGGTIKFKILSIG